jgi:hypothetical protein
MRRLTGLALLVLMACASPVGPDTSPPVVPAPAPGDYTVLYIPDTQFYSESYPSIWLDQVNWIASRDDSLNLVFVSHLGDLVDNVGSSVEWQRASGSMAVLDAIVPVGIAPGNHDIEDNWIGVAGSWATYRQYFPTTRYAGKPYWGGAYASASRASSFQRITVGAEQLLFLHLEYQAPDDVLAWAKGVVDAHPNHRVHLSTHSYLTPSTQRLDSSPFVRGNGNSGEAIWQEFVRHAPNVRMVHSAHFCGETRQVSVNDAGKRVDEILTDYQCLPNGGDGWLRFYVFKPSVGEIHAYTYSPTLDRFDTDSESQFVLPYTPAGI